MRMQRPLTSPSIAALMLSLLMAATYGLHAQSEPTYPAWWYAHGLISGTAYNDFAAANQGELKNFATAAISEFNLNLPGGAGTTLNLLATSLSATSGSTSDFAAVNLGQLKAIVQPFYDQLELNNFMGLPLTPGQTYPWSGSSSSPSDYAIANIGELKNMFSFSVLPIPYSLDLEPPDPEIPVNSQQQFSVFGTDQYGNPIALANLNWSASGGGTVNNGIFTAGGSPGTETVEASVGSASGSTSVTVDTLASMAISPNPATVAAGSQEQFSVTGNYGSGLSFNLNNAGWSVNGGGSISSAGLLTTSATSGTYVVTAVSGTTTATGTLTIYTPVLYGISITPYAPSIATSSTMDFLVSGVDLYGTPVPVSNQGVTWTTSSGTISNLDGIGVLTSGTQSGTYSVGVTIGTKTASTPIYVGNPDPTATLTGVYPSAAVIMVSSAQVFKQYSAGVWVYEPYWYTYSPYVIVPSAGTGVFEPDSNPGTTTVSTAGGGATVVIVGEGDGVQVPLASGISPGNILERPANWQGKLSAYIIDTSYNYWVLTDITWSGSGAGTITNYGVVTLNGTTGTFVVYANLEQGSTFLTGTIHSYSTSVSTIGDGLSDWQNYMLGISSTNYNNDGYTNAQNISMGINPFIPYNAPPSLPSDPGDTTPPTIVITMPPPGATIPP